MRISSLSLILDGEQITDFSKFKEKGKIMTLVVNYVGGNKVTYTGVKLLKFTPNELDGKTAKESQLVFSAADRK